MFYIQRNYKKKLYTIYLKSIGHHDAFCLSSVQPNEIIETYANAHQLCCVAKHIIISDVKRLITPPRAPPKQTNKSIKMWFFEFHHRGLVIIFCARIGNGPTCCGCRHTTDARQSCGHGSDATSVTCRACHSYRT